MKTLIYTNPYGIKHDTTPGHPECPARLRVLNDLFSEQPFCDWLIDTHAEATIEQLTLAHPEDYIFDLQDHTPDDGYRFIDNDTVLCPNSYDAVIHAVGTVCQAMDDIAKAPADTRAFCAIRPPGHHAEATTAMGFCLFNNIFIAARHAQEQHGFKKIAIIDFDVHHGNGTENLARAHNEKHPETPIFYASTHIEPQWPMTGDPQNNTTLICNATLNPHEGSNEFCEAYKNHIFPALKDFAPEFILISAGFDAHTDDPLASLNLTEDDFYWITQQICLLATQHCNGKILSVLEGGYDLNALKNAVRAHLLALNNQEI